MRTLSRWIITFAVAFCYPQAFAEREPASISPVYVPDLGVIRPSLRNDASKPDLEPNADEDSSRLTGGWGGLRKKLTDRGLDLALVYTVEYNRTFEGGVNQGSTALGNLNVKAAVDMEKLTDVKGLSFFFFGLGNHGGDPSAYVGDVQVTSNIETADNAFRLYEAWVQQIFFEDHVSLLLGLHDLNSEFYVTETSSLFFNSSFGIGRDLSQTGVNGPSIFPATAPAVRLRIEPTKDFYIQSALFNGVAGDPAYPQGTHVRLSADDGAFVITEAAFLRGRKEGSGLDVGKYGFGFWSYTKAVAKIDQPDVQATDAGYYFLIDQSFSSTTSAFFRAGFANADLNPVKRNLSTGFVVKGLVPGRASNRAGMAVTQVESGDAYRRSQNDEGTSLALFETAFELNYRFELPHGFALQPDLQYLSNPGFSDSIDAAMVFSTRLEINF